MNPLSEICPECESDACREVVEDYSVTTADGESIVVPQITLWRCDKCQSKWLSPEAAEAVDAFVAAATDELSPGELQSFLDTFHLSQAEAAQALGLGEKTITRWLNGRQAPSRSMGYYIRTLTQFPQALEWLRNRGWKASPQAISASPLLPAAKSLKSARKKSVASTSLSADAWPHRVNDRFPKPASPGKSEDRHITVLKQKRS